MTKNEKLAVFENVVKWRKGRNAGIEDFSLGIRNRETILIYGSCGMMHELFRVAGQLEKPDDGEITIRGTLAYIPVEFPLWNRLRVQDYVLFALEERKNKQLTEMERSIWKESHLWEKRTFPIQYLSECEKEKLLYLMAFVKNPSILVIGNIGKVFTKWEEEELWSLVDRYREINSMAVLCISECRNVPYPFDRVYRFLNGKVEREEEE